MGYCWSFPCLPSPTQGKVERLHQTMKKWLGARSRARTLADLQAQVDEFRSYDNEIRPHRAIGRRPPALAYAARPKAVPHDGPLDASQFRVRRDVIDGSGTVTLRHGSRLHHIGVGRRLAGTEVLLVVQDLHIRIVGRGRRPDQDPRFGSHSELSAPDSGDRVNDVLTQVRPMSRDITQREVFTFGPELDLRQAIPHPPTGEAAGAHTEWAHLAPGSAR